MLSDDEQQSVSQGLRTGSQAAWNRLYDEYSADVWRYVARLSGGNATHVADIVQRVFLAAARSAQAYDPSRGTLARWLLGIAHRQSSLYWREAERAERWRQLAEAGAVEVRQWWEDGASAEDVFERRELADLVRGVLAELPVETAALLVGKYVDQRSLAELANELGGSLDAIKSRLARARRDFRAQFEQRAGLDRPARSP